MQYRYPGNNFTAVASRRRMVVREHYSLCLIRLDVLRRGAQQNRLAHKWTQWDAKAEQSWLPVSGVLQPVLHWRLLRRWTRCSIAAATAAPQGRKTVWLVGAQHIQHISTMIKIDLQVDIHSSKCTRRPSARVATDCMRWHAINKLS